MTPPSRGSSSLRFKIFCALGVATLTGALATGLYATALDQGTLGFLGRLVRVFPKALSLAAVLLPLSAGCAALVAKMLARSVEELSDAAGRIAEGEWQRPVPRGHGAETRALSRALSAIQREIAVQPYAAATLRDAWHDLKTPLAAIVATLEVLEDGALDEPETARRFLASLRRSADQLEQRLEGVVTLARLQTSRSEAHDSLSLRELVEDAVRDVQPLAAARHVELRTGHLPARRVRGDEAALTRALGNLLENAIEANPGGFVQVDVDGRARRRVTLDVSNGPSFVPRELHGRLFERSATARKRGGSGLGLAIVRAAVEAHGGKVCFLELGPPRVAVRIELPC